MESAYEPTYRHPALGFEVEPAGGWSLLEEDDRTAVMAVASEGASRPAIVTVAAQPIDPGWDAATFADEALAAQAATLGRLRVIDRAAETIGGLPAVRVVLQRPGDDGEVVVLDEWRVAQDGRGWTVSAYCPIAAYAALAPAVRATAQSLLLPPPADLPAPRVTFDPVEGVLSLTAEDLTALTEHDEGGAGDPAGLTALEAAGVLAGGVVDPLVADMLAAVRAADLKITVQGRAADAMAWWHDGRAVLLLAADAERRQLTAVDGGRLPGLLADMLAIGPRATAEDRAPMRTTVAELTRLFGEPRGAGALPPAADAGAPVRDVAELVARHTDHWRIDAVSSDPPYHAILEAFDAPGGYWLVRPAGDEVLLEPTTAAGLWAHLAELAEAR
jgi:hypothetical protein